MLRYILPMRILVQRYIFALQMKTGVKESKARVIYTMKLVDWN